MAEETERDRLARVEKYAQAHFDRVHTVGSGATKAALAWLVALGLIWWQQLEPKLTQVRAAQTGRRALIPASTLGPERIGVLAQFENVDDLAKQEAIELPFSIKLKLPPEWVPTLWLALGFGLTLYLVDARRRMLRMAGRAVRILEKEVNCEPPYVRRMVGAAVWWLAPIPKKGGSHITVAQFRQALGWGSRASFAGTFAIMVCFILLMAAETRVLYLGFCTTSYLTGPDHPGYWLLLAAVNCLLFCGSALSISWWFAPAAVPDALDDEQPARVDRRQVLGLLAKGTVVCTGAFVWAASSTYAIAAVTRRKKPEIHGQASARTKRKRRARHSHAPKLPDGLYANTRTGVVHTASPACKTCLAGINAGSLVKTDGADVRWNMTAVRRSLPELRRTSAPNSTGPPSAVSASQRGSSTSKNPLDAKEKRPHSAHRAFMVERRVFDLLDMTNEAAARGLLVEAIQATSVFGLKTGMRLYDLLAGLSVRFGWTEERSVLIRVLQDEVGRVKTFEMPRIQQLQRGRILSFLYSVANNELREDRSVQKRRNHERHSKDVARRKGTGPVHAGLPHNQYLQAVVADKIKKWQDPNGRWYKLWLDRQHPVMWAGRTIA